MNYNNNIWYTLVGVNQCGRFIVLDYQLKRYWLFSRSEALQKHIYNHLDKMSQEYIGYAIDKLDFYS